MGSISRLIAFRKGSTLYYVVPDHLGSTFRVVDTSGGTIDDIRYHAFGATRSGGTNLQTDKRFTGQILDSTTGLYFYNARYYDSSLGRFLSPDSIVPQPGNPQSLNRYSYTLNNPLRYTDPTGHRQIDLDNDDESYAYGPADDRATSDIETLNEIDPTQMGPIQYIAYADPYFPANADEYFYSGDITGVPHSNVRENMEIAAKAGASFGSRPNDALMSNLEFRERVKTGSNWDFKKHDPKKLKYQNYGNFNYGAVGTAWGLSENNLVVGAGLAQAKSDIAQNIDYLSRLDKSKGPGPAPRRDGKWGDDFRDQYMIEIGIQFAKVSLRPKVR